ncbi:MAG: DUF1820 family protein [Spirochaetales bacterium]|nr:DUF1820 family protein [Spirochaetales bacterium]
MSLYKVHFKWKEKELSISAKNLDLTHPYFVSIKELILPSGSGLIINPEEDEIRKTFGDADHLMIPFQTVILIEEIINPDKKEKPTLKSPIPGGLSLIESSDNEKRNEERDK